MRLYQHRHIAYTRVIRPVAQFLIWGPIIGAGGLLMVPVALIVGCVLGCAMLVLPFVLAIALASAVAVGTAISLRKLTSAWLRLLSMLSDRRIRQSINSRFASAKIEI